MQTPYGLHIIDDCVACPVREERLFCNLSPAAVNKLSQITSTAVYPNSAVLFMEGQKPRGVFVLCSGKAKLSTSSADGKTITLKIAECGDVLGLNAVISDCPYEATAEMSEPGQANFIPRDVFLVFLREHGEVALRVAELLSRNYYAAYQEIRMLGLSRSPAARLAKLLLDWLLKTADSSQYAAASRQPERITITMTQGEIAEMIGTTRETVSRLFSDFKKKQIVRVKGASLIIRDKPALEELANL